MATINLGKVKVTPEGQYDPSKSYAELSLVGHEGSSYISIQDVPAGVSPTNTAYWQLHGSKGADGTNGADGNDGIDAYQPFKGWYDDSTTLSTAFPSPQVGDYAFVAGSTASDPVTVYKCTTAGTWAASSSVFNPANNQSFQTGQDLDQTKIINDPATGGANHVLSAEAGKTINAKVSALGPKIGEMAVDVETTFTSGYIYNGAVRESANFKYSAPIHLVKGDILLVSSAGNAFDVFSRTNSSGSSYTKLIQGDSTTTDVKDYTYTATEDMYVAVSVKILYDYSIKLKHTDFIKREDITDVLREGSVVDSLNSDATNLPVSAAAVKSLSTRVGNSPIPVTENGESIDTSGDTISAPITSSEYLYMIYPVSAGDIVTITGTGGGSRRLWAFADSEGNVLSRSEEGAHASNLQLIAPTNAAKVIINIHHSFDAVYSAYYSKSDSLSAITLSKSDVINNYTTEDPTRPVSAAVAKTLRAEIVQGKTNFDNTIGQLKSPMALVAGATYQNEITIDGKTNDVYYCRLNVPTGCLLNDVYIIYINHTSTQVVGSAPVGEWVKVILPSNATTLTAYKYKLYVSGGYADAVFEVLTPSGIMSRLRALENGEGQGLGPATNLVETPSAIFGFAYNYATAYLNKLNFMHRLYIEGIANGNGDYASLRIDGDVNAFAQVDGFNGSLSEGDYTRTYNITCKGYGDGSISVPLKMSDPYNLVGKDIRIMHIGDSLTEGGIPTATSAILSKMSTDYGGINFKTVGHKKNTIYINLKGSEAMTTACHAGTYGWAASDYLRHFCCVRASGSASAMTDTVICGQVAWDAIGLGTMTRNGVPQRSYVSFEKNDTNAALVKNTPHGYYDADPTAALWDWIVNKRHLTTFTYNGTTYTFGSSYSSADDATQIAAIKYLCEHPTNPFFDIDTVESSNGSYAFSFAKYMARYKTLADDGTTRLVVGSTAGTEVSDATAYDLCNPTHIAIIMTENGRQNVTTGIGYAADLALIAELIQDYASANNLTIKVAIGTTRTYGAFVPNMYNWAGFFAKKSFVPFHYNVYKELKDIAVSNTNFTFLPIYAIQSVFGGGSGNSIDTLDEATRNRYIGDTVHGLKATMYLDMSSEVVAWMAYTFRT